MPKFRIETKKTYKEASPLNNCTFLWSDRITAASVSEIIKEMLRENKRINVHDIISLSIEPIKGKRALL